MISFIVPAHNERAGIGRTLQAIHASARALPLPYEIIVVNDASTDATAEIAQQNAARVISVNHRQIAATRNSGGREARGDRLFFVDADTTINPSALASALQCMDDGAAGGGATVRFEGDLPLYARLLSLVLAPPIAKMLGFTGGAFMFCTRNAFQASGGFDERLYCGEEGSLALALKRHGRFVVLWEQVLTSGRRFRTMSGLRLLGTCARLAFSPANALTSRSSVEKIWYDSNRDRDDKAPGTLGAKLSNAITLLILIVLLTGPLWNFVPWSLTPLASPLGKFRFVMRAFLSHVGLIFWPLGIALFVSLWRRMHPTEWLKLTALTAFCIWQAWASTRAAIWVWTQLQLWLARLGGG